MQTTCIWVDGGGSGTRVRIRTSNGLLLESADGGPSALAQGVDLAWRNINEVVAQTFVRAQMAAPGSADCTLAIGVSGAEIEGWRNAFIAANPGYRELRVATDGTTSLLGAHGAAPGVMIACGTGVVGEVLRADGQRATVGGWGFPIGDEGSGAWLGQRAVAGAMQSIDGRLPTSPLSEAIRNHCGRDRFAILEWAFHARPADFALLAPLVFAHESVDVAASQLIATAVHELDRVALALDPSQTLPIAMLGSIGKCIAQRMLTYKLGLHVSPKGNALDGASRLFEQSAEVWS